MDRYGICMRFNLIASLMILFIDRQVCSAEQKVDEAGGGGTMKVAIKKLTRPFQSAIHAKRTYREFRLLKQIKHENVIGLLDVFSPACTMSEMSDIYFVTHFMGADLNQIIKTQKVSLLYWLRMNLIDSCLIIPLLFVHSCQTIMCNS